MLSLTRKPSESFTFQIKDNNGNVTEFVQYITNIKGKQVRVGFDLPNNVNVVRTELIK